MVTIKEMQKMKTMKTRYIPFGKAIVSVLVALLSVGLGTQAVAQSINGTQQLPNRGFEEYDNLGTKNVEPVGWNSFMTAKTNGATALGQAQRLDRVSDKRPGTAGNYSLKAYSTTVIGVNANGNVTTGRINMGSTTATDASNHNFTDRESEGFNLPFTTIPDSMVVWVKYAPDNASDAGQIKAVLHGDYATIDPGTNMNQAVAVATVQPQKGNGGFIRYSVPFDKTGCGSKDPRYMLVSITTNKTPGGGGASIYVDDILFVYNPVLTVGALPSSSFNMKNKVAFSIPFTVTGTLPLNSNSEQKNRVVAEISDAAGSFANPRVIGSVETEESGSVEVEIPSDMPLGDHYRIRLRATDRQILSEPSQEFSLIRGYTVRVTADANQGIVSGAGAYVENTTAVLVATPLTGYHFVAWMEGTDTVGKAPEYRFTVNADRNLTALFAINTYTVKILVEGEGTARTVTGRTEFNHNERVRLEAFPAENYEFSGYYAADGGLLSTNEEYYFNIVSDMTITAVFARRRITITAGTQTPNLGSVSGGGLYAYGDEVKLTATAMPYCHFVAWMEGRDTVGKNPEYRFTAQNNRTITAVFDQEYHYVTVRPNIMGAGVLTGGGRYSAANSHTTITLKAQPNIGYEFLYWQSEKDGQRIEDTVFTVLEDGRLTEDLEYTAWFAIEKYDISVEAVPAGAGTFEGDGQYEYRDRVTLRAIPEPAYDFVAWVRVDHQLSDTSRSNPLVFPIEEGRNRQYKALFKLKRYTLSLSAEPVAYGSVRGGGEYSHFDTAVLIAEPNAGYEFRYWGIRRGLNIEKVSEENPCRLVMLQDEERVAVFSQTRKMVNAQVLPQNAGSVRGTGLYDAATYAVLEVEPAFGYRFSHWEDADGNTGLSDNRLNLLVKNDTTVYARFIPLRYTFTLMTEGASGLGDVRIDDGAYGARHVQEVHYGQQIRISARSNRPDYSFTQWRMVYTQNGQLKDTLYSRNSEETYVVSGESRIVAYFYANSHRIASSVQPDAACGKVRNQGAYRHELWMELVAEPAAGYAFSHWEDNAGNVIGGTSSRLQIQSLKDSSVQAFFKIDTLDVQVAVWGGKANGHITGQGRYEYGKTVRVEAEPAYGYAFAGWYKESDSLRTACLSKEAAYSFTVSQDERLAAAFVPGKFNIQVQIEPENAGSVSGAGNYTYLSEAVLRAIPAGGYALKYFLLEEENSSKVDTIRATGTGFRMYRNKKVRVCFEPIPYSLQVFSSHSGRGTVSSSQESLWVGYGSEVSVSAEPKENYAFTRWRDAYGNRISRSADFTLRISQDTVIYADFEPVSKAFRAEPRDEAQGYVIPYDNRPRYGSMVQVEAVPLPGYVFSRWVLAGTETTVSRSSLLSCMITQDTSFEACFEPAFRAISLGANIAEAGDVRMDFVTGQDTVDNGRYAYLNHPQEIILTASPNGNYTFKEYRRVGLLREGITIGLEPVLEINSENYSEDVEIEAVFEPKFYRTSVQAQPVVAGTVYGAGMYEYGDSVRVRATAGPAYAFKGWRTGDGWVGTEPEYTFTIGKDTALTAFFVRDSVWVSVSASSGGHVAGAGFYEKGTPVSLQATPVEGYAFEAWRDTDGNVVSNRSSYQFNAEESVSLRAVFAPEILQCAVEANEGGSVLGGGAFAYGSMIQVEAVADVGYRFEAWESELMEIPEDQASLPLLSFQVKENTELRAVFKAERFSITTNVSPLGTGTVTRGESFDYGTKVSFEAKPDANHVFQAWTLDGKTVATEPVLQVDVREDASYVAVFSSKRYNVVTSVYPDYGGLTYGGGSYFWNDTARIGIYLYDSVLFRYWSNAAFEQVGSKPEYLYTVTHTEIFTATVDAPEPIGDTVVPGPNDDTVSSGKIVVYPNPLREGSDLHFVSGKENILSVRFFSLSGKHVLYRKFSENGVKEAVVRLPQLQAGCYFYEIRLVGGKRKLGKLVKL